MPQPVQGDPDQTTYDNWEIWLYSRGYAPDGGAAGRWGTITGKSAESVESQLKASQTFEKHWVKWCHCGDSGSTTFFNALGPIAVLPHQTVFGGNRALVQLNQSHELFDKIYGLIKMVDDVAEMADEQSILPKGPFIDFANRTHDAIDQAAELGSALSNANGAALFGISGQLDSLDQELDALKTQSDAAIASLGHVKRRVKPAASHSVAASHSASAKHHCSFDFKTNGGNIQFLWYRRYTTLAECEAGLASTTRSGDAVSTTPCTCQ